MNLNSPVMSSSRPTVFGRALSIISKALGGGANSYHTDIFLDGPKPSFNQSIKRLRVTLINDITNVNMMFKLFFKENCFTLIKIHFVLFKLLFNYNKALNILFTIDDATQCLHVTRSAKHRSLSESFFTFCFACYVKFDCILQSIHF